MVYVIFIDYICGITTAASNIDLSKSSNVLSFGTVTIDKNNIDLEFSGQVVLITGAASGIGRACVESFLNRGAAVIALDVANSIKTISNHQNFLKILASYEVQVRGKSSANVWEVILPKNYTLGKMILPMFTKVADNFHLSSFFFSVKFLVHFLSKKFERFSDFILFKIKAKIFRHNMD